MRVGVPTFPLDGRSPERTPKYLDDTNETGELLTLTVECEIAATALATHDEPIHPREPSRSNTSPRRPHPMGGLEKAVVLPEQVALETTTDDVHRME